VCDQHHQQRHDGHRQADRQNQKVALPGRQQMVAQCQIQHHEGKFAAAAQDHRQP
jgi:hypothetical protein